MIFIVALERGMLDRFETIRGLRQAAIMVIGMIQYFASVHSSKIETSCTLVEGGKAMSVKYTHNGDKMWFHIPFDKSIKAEMEMWRVHLDKNFGNSINSNNIIDITQQPGIPYTCTARMLGGKRIIAKHKLDDKKTVIYDTDLVPNFYKVKKSA